MSRLGHNVAAVERFPLEAGQRFTFHSHRSHQLTTAADGVLTVHLTDRSWILPRSRALWIPAGVRHEIAASRSAVLRSAYVSPAHCPVTWTSPTPIAADELLVGLLIRLERKDLSTSQRRRSEALLIDVIEPVDTATIATPMPTDPRALAVADAIIADPADPRTIEQWGRAAGATGRTLARLFTAETGLSFGQWRTSVRLSAAIEELARGRTVTQTARAVGYETVSAFIAAFSRELGSTPATYFASNAISR